jgi:hypothetical protein
LSRVFVLPMTSMRSMVTCGPFCTSKVRSTVFASAFTEVTGLMFA